MATDWRIKALMDEAENKAWKSLGGYKFVMFGYHAANWVNLNKLLAKPLPNPFGGVVQFARNRTRA